MKLNFSSQKYKKKAMDDAKNFKYENKHSVEDAFFLLINDVDSESLSNLCKYIKTYFIQKDFPCDISLEECYRLTQGEDIEGKVELTETLKNVIYQLSYICLESGKPLGHKKTADGKYYTSDWIGHSLFEGKLCGELAEKLGLDVARAQKLGLLHDYGRKKDQTVGHITGGYEELSDLGWDESIGCLSHSFLNGGRCSWNANSLKGFIVNSEGNTEWADDAEVDDIKEWLDNYIYTEYDYVLNVADLMATSSGIVTPAQRIADITTRRSAFEGKSRKYFLSEFTNILVEMTEKFGGEIPEDLRSKVRATENITLPEIQEKFEMASDLFWGEYQKSILVPKVDGGIRIPTGDNDAR